PNITRKEAHTADPTALAERRVHQSVVCPTLQTEIGGNGSTHVTRNTGTQHTSHTLLTTSDFPTGGPHRGGS
ncbi:Hypothetical predicted protein, partial [Pelobates cultripes]